MFYAQIVVETQHGAGIVQGFSFIRRVGSLITPAHYVPMST